MSIHSALFSERRPRGRRQLIKTVVRGRFESVAPLLQHSANTAGCFCVIHLHEVTAWRMDAQSEAMLCDIDASRTSLARILICEIDWVHLSRPLFCSAQVRPIDVRSDVFAADCAAAFALDVDGQGFGAGLAVGDVGQVTTGRAATLGERFALSDREAHEEGFELVHGAHITLSGVV